MLAHTTDSVPALATYHQFSHTDGDWKFLPALPTFTTLQICRIATGTLLFISGTYVQTTVHEHLRALKSRGTYSIPTHPYFRYTLTPHYFAECIEYLGLALICAPSGHVFSRSVLCCLVFVVVNLGVTADGTRTWYVERFGAEKIRGKSRMMPFVW